MRHEHVAGSRPPALSGRRRSRDLAATPGPGGASRAMRAAELVYAPVSGARRLRGSAVWIRTDAHGIAAHRR
ncbi:MAG: hypothetical protein OXC25_06000 [Thiotrichales bacterium]|nr:hypothetical protein [Thiotrichales bacterium]